MVPEEGSWSEAFEVPASVCFPQMWGVVTGDQQPAAQPHTGSGVFLFPVSVFANTDELTGRKGMILCIDRQSGSWLLTGSCHEALIFCGFP